MTPKTIVHIVVAITKKNAAIGNGGNLLFRISDDLKRFRALTKNHPVIMGRKTFESIGKPLPERTNIIISRNQEFKAEGCILVTSLPEAIKKAGEIDGDIFIIGGGEIYKQALPFTDILHLTIVESTAEGDVFFPDWQKDFTKEIFRENRFDEKTGLHYSWIDLKRS